MNAGNTPPSGKDDSSLVENKAKASAAAGNTPPPSGKDDSRAVKSLTAAMFGGVKAIYKSAWTRDPSVEKVIHVVIDAAISVIAPVAVVWSAIDTRVTYSVLFHPFVYVFLVPLPFVLFVFACYFLTKHAKDHAPLLAFSVLLFFPGAVFTAHELLEHSHNYTIPHFQDCAAAGKWMDCVSDPPVPLRECGECDERDPAGNPPWGDFLLAFSAFCVMVEEFRLFGIYYKVVDRRIKETKRAVEAATRSREKQIVLMEAAARDHAELIELKRSAKKEHDELVELHRSMSDQSKEWHQSRQAVLFKACGVVAIIVLAFTSMCG